MSRLKFKIIRYTLLAYVLLTLWQVLGKREDYPLSSFPMFSHVREFPGNADRTVLVGVNEHGEVPLDPSAVSSMMSAPRLQKIFQQLQKKSDRKQTEFMRRVAGVLRASATPGDPFWAVRFYSETWRAQLHLKGIENPTRSLEFASYIPPPGLVQALAAEAKSGAPAPAPRALPSGDVLIELDARACGASCSVVTDALASGGKALRLAEGGSLHLTVPGSGYGLMLRMRTQADAGDDRLTLEVDGKRPKNAKEGIGNYKRALPYDGWVWASLEPGWPAYRLKSKHDETSEVVLRADHADIEIDQVWLSRARTELPIWNAPLAPSATGDGT